MSLVVRERRDDDVPALAVVLAEQQSTSRYPVRWPLPIPVEDFLVRPGEERAWVAELDGRVVGHVAVYTLDGDLREPFVAAIGTEDLAELAVLFVAADVIGTGVGGRLHDTAVDWIVATGRQPVLDVVPVHDASGRGLPAPRLGGRRRGAPGVAGRGLPDADPDDAQRSSVNLGGRPSLRAIVASSKLPVSSRR